MKKKNKKIKALSLLLSFAMILSVMMTMIPAMEVKAADDYKSLKNTTTVVKFDGKDWYLIDYDDNDNTVTLLSKECVAASQYNSSGSYVEYNSNPTVKTAVDTYYNNTLSENAKTAVSENKMFLLTTDEAKAIYDANPDVLKCSQYGGTNYNAWWLSSHGSDYTNGAARVGGNDGYVDAYGTPVRTNLLGVRPALKLNLSSVIFSSDTKTFSVETPVSGVTLDKTETQTINIGGIVKFMATVLPEGASDKTVKWSTSSSKVRLYSDESCTILVGGDATDTLTVYAKGFTAGEDSITVTSNSDSTKTASCNINVKRFEPTVGISPDGAGTVILKYEDENYINGDLFLDPISNAGYEFDHWSYNSGDTSSSSSLTYTNQTNIVAHFKPVSSTPDADNKGETDIITDVKKDEKSPELSAVNLTDEFAEATLSNEEKTDIETAIEQGKNVDVEVYIEISDINDSVDTDDKEKITALVVDADNIEYFDISLFKKISIAGQSQGVTSLHELTTPLKLTIVVPKSFPAVADGYTRTYEVIRLHDGKAEKLPTTVNADGTITFETDKFSTYALAYTDTKKEEVKEPTTETPTTEATTTETPTTTVDTPTTKVDTPTQTIDTPSTSADTPKAPTTGDKINLAVVIMLMIDSAMGAVYFTLRRRMTK